ncbi:Fic domain protein [Campylobacter ureolyticus RIGS 9880]|uniref:Fic domain protein n=1 Tax=Campylobacter ureolyticus RIGS 9880 TaxID=1032069 RepID=A0AAU8U2J6_9BACT|nr:Fic family protein [Campylobacter ureolyticus]AKT90676.1 Fic domain protein [Campylobacter ureolyticus RIGS 9880]
MSAYDILIDEFNNKTPNGLYYLTQINFSYNSNKIEGSKLSKEQTRYIYETSSLLSQKDEVIRVDDIIETINHFKAFDFMLETAKKSLDENYIKNIHKLLKQGITKNQIIGKFKTKQNYIGDFITTRHENVSKEINNLLNTYNEVENITIDDIIDFHHKFESIHPFEDGNGRVGRLIMFKECLKNNITPFIIDEEHKLFYYRGLREYKTTKGFLIDTCLNAQDIYAEILKNHTKNNI